MEKEDSGIKDSGATEGAGVTQFTGQLMRGFRHPNRDEGYSHCVAEDWGWDGVSGVEVLVFKKEDFETFIQQTVIKHLENLRAKVS